MKEFITDLLEKTNQARYNLMSQQIIIGANLNAGGQITTDSLNGPSGYYVAKLTADNNNFISIENDTNDLDQTFQKLIITPGIYLFMLSRSVVNSTSNSVYIAPLSDLNDSTKIIMEMYGSSNSGTDYHTDIIAISNYTEYIIYGTYNALHTLKITPLVILPS